MSVGRVPPGILAEVGGHGTVVGLVGIARETGHLSVGQGFGQGFGWRAHW